MFGHNRLIAPKIHNTLFLFPTQDCIIVHCEQSIFSLNSTIKKALIQTFYSLRPFKFISSVQATPSAGLGRNSSLTILLLVFYLNHDVFVVLWLLSFFADNIVSQRT